FFFRAEDGIRDRNVTGVQTYALPIFEAYSLRYPGEVLERFEEKLGTDIRILRALALALGYTRRCQADTMFVGNQRNDFIQKLRKIGRASCREREKMKSRDEGLQI